MIEARLDTELELGAPKPVTVFVETRLDCGCRFSDFSFKGECLVATNTCDRHKRDMKPIYEIAKAVIREQLSKLTKGDITCPHCKEPFNFFDVTIEDKKVDGVT